MVDSLPGNDAECIRDNPKVTVYNDPIAKLLKRVYLRYHHSRFIHPDPLEIVRRYRDVRDREVVALVVSSLSLGRVSGIIAACEAVLAPLGTAPARTLSGARPEQIDQWCRGFVYRFFNAGHLGNLLNAVAVVMRRHGSLEQFFLNGYHGDHRTTVPALEAFVSGLHEVAAGPMSILLPLPGRNGTMKRMHLFLRWMVRCDRIDPGGWTGLTPAQLVAPIDTHMHRIGRLLEFTSRRACSIRTALEVTEGLRLYDPVDPVRFDFSLTRLGIHPDLGYDELSAMLRSVYSTAEDR